MPKPPSNYPSSRRNPSRRRHAGQSPNASHKSHRSDADAHMPTDNNDDSQHPQSDRRSKKHPANKPANKKAKEAAKGAHQPLGKRTQGKRNKNPHSNQPHGNGDQASSGQAKFPSKQLLNQLYRQKTIRRRRQALLRGSTMILGIIASIALFIGWSVLRPNFPIDAVDNNGGWNVAMPKVLSMPPPPDMVLLVMGVDVNPDARAGDAMDAEHAFNGVRTDTMVLARITPPKGNNSKARVGAISIPRDSKVYLTDSGRIGKINGAFAFGGAERAVNVVERTTGVPVDHYMVINLQGVADVINAIGGVDLTIDKAMNYHDNSGKLHINFEPGTHHLNGEDAVRYLRFRHDNLGDIGRIRRQQALMAAVAKQLKNPWTLARLPGIIDALQRNMQTDIPVNRLLQLGWMGKSLSPHQLSVATLPGTPVMEDGSYWLINPDSARSLINTLILNDRVFKQYSTSRSAKPTAANINGGINTGYEQPFANLPSVKTGLIAPDSWTDEQLDLFEDQLSKGGMAVICRSRRPATSQVIEHRQVKYLPARLKATEENLLLNIQHVIAPIGSTYENNFCSGREAMTIMLGQEYSNWQGS